VHLLELLRHFSRNAASLNVGFRILDPFQLGGALDRDVLAHLLAADLALARSLCGKSSLLHIIPQLGELCNAARWRPASEREASGGTAIIVCAGAGDVVGPPLSPGCSAGAPVVGGSQWPRLSLGSSRAGRKKQDGNDENARTRCHDLATLIFIHDGCSSIW
jgi:hypothetical protein